METLNPLKEIVREKYSQIALQDRQENANSCCGVNACCSTVDYEVFAENYENLKGYVADADLGLGCGLPTEFAQIKEGDTVVDLGSGAGNDAFVARATVGEKGKIIGVDMTEAMISKARQNAEKLGFNNVEFRFGDIEKMPISAETANVVVSNCVMNLVPDKEKAFAETFRILKKGGHFSISDIVLQGELPDRLRQDAEMYAGCVSGAIQQTEYLEIIQKAGFENIKIQKSKVIDLPKEILEKYISGQEMANFEEGKIGIFSITVFAQKPCCDPKSGCCS